MLTPAFLDEAEVRARLPMGELIEAMQQALVQFSSGGVCQPVRTVFPFCDHSYFGSMPCWAPSLPALGAKLATVCPSNRALHLAAHQATIVMLDPTTGIVDAIIDGRFITEARTAAVSALSARLLAREDAEVLAIIGSGVQARSHVEALKLVRRFRQIRAWSPNRERLHQFALDTGAIAMTSAESAVEGADVVVTVTSSSVPVIQNDWVADGTHIIAVGACVPMFREIDPMLTVRARLIVDSRVAALRESGDVVMGIAEGHFTADHIDAELGELPVRRDAREVTLFKSLGLAVEDLFAAHLVLTKARSDR